MTKTEKKHINAIKERDFLTAFRSGYKGTPSRSDTIIRMEQIDKKIGYRLYGMEGYRKYSRNCVYYVSYRYLTGVEKGQYWANRVPGTINTISEAIDWLKPAEVKKAKKVLRQGDVFIIPKIKDCKSILPDRHEWDQENRVLKHPEHDDIFIPFPCKFVSVKTMNNLVAD